MSAANHPDQHADPPERYSRQVLFDRIGAKGQRRLMGGRVTLVGCGALGTALAETLVRAGVGLVRICDRDFIEINNLQRQTLFDESDIAAGLPKAEAAKAKLGRINSQVTVEAHVVDVNPTNVRRLAEGADLLLDGTDNFETRYLINDLAVCDSIPWIYGAVIGATGLVLPILPGQTPCLRCVFDTPPPAELSPTCDTAGVLAPAVAVVAAFQCVEAFKILTGRLDEVNRCLSSIDVWTGRVVNLNVASAAGRDECTCCGQRRFEYLDGRAAATTTHLCGRNAVQINRTGGRRVDLEALADKLAPVADGSVTRNRFLLRARLDDCALTLFPDGRAIVQGTDDPDRARTVYAKYVGT
ncbi:MAG: thiazole biosynthesis adenylyltransferase ThiF [bacterium]|nr:thiazole biosynthesis adenylyltransferase ThiF [bacterium]